MVINIYWKVETTDGGFEGDNLKILLNNIINYYKDEVNVPQITELYAVINEEKEKDFFGYIPGVQYILEEKFEKLQEYYKQNRL